MGKGGDSIGPLAGLSEQICRTGTQHDFLESKPSNLSVFFSDVK